MGTVRILNAIQTKKASKPKEMIFAEVTVAGTKMSALIDTGASDLLVLEEAAKKLNLRVEKKDEWLKMVNSEKVPTHGFAKDVEFTMGSWRRQENIDVVPLDDYDMIIELGFIEWINAMVVPAMDCMYILDPRSQCVIPLGRELGNDRKVISAI